MMKRSAVLGMAFVAGCMAAEPTESTATSELNIGTMTETWDTKSTTKIDTLWPTTTHSTQLIMRVGPDKFGNPAFLAFVVWDHTTVGHVYWVTIGDEGADLKQAWENAFALRTNTHPANFDRWGGGNGGGGTGTPPTPHPNVDSFFVGGTWLSHARTTAADLDAADASFNTYAE